MAFVVARRSGSWELRESRTTPAGPRARTLATFRTLTPEVIERARGRASRPFDPDDVRASARRAGAPVATGDADRAAGELLAALTGGQPPRPVLARLLADALQVAHGGSPDRPRGRAARDAPSDSARSAAAWIAASAQSRGEALRDLLLLADRLPARTAPRGPGFPRLRSTPA